MMKDTEKTMRITGYELKEPLPDPFRFDDGSCVSTKEDWQKRRKEIYRTAVGLQYGGAVPAPEVFRVDPLYDAGEKKAASFRITAGTKEKTLSFTVCVFRASTEEKLPTVISGDLCFNYAYDWEHIRLFLDNRINLVLFNRTEICPDLARYNVNCYMRRDSEEFAAAKAIVDGQDAGRKTGPIYEVYPDGEFGTIAAWAWGYSRCVDALEFLGIADERCIVFTGQSRGAKTAILAGALDERAAIVHPNVTCAGGCSCYRLKIRAIKEDGTEAESEDIANIFRHFPQWMGQGMRPYIDHEEDLPFDSHFLKALIAPRILFDSEAADDIMGNPVGSWQTTKAAEEVYRFLGVPENLYWYFRKGDHAYELEDVRQLVNVICHVHRGEALNDKFFKTPFKEPELAFSWRAPERND